MKKMRPEKIDHIHIAVKDMKKAMEFFSDMFGLEFSSITTEQEDNEELGRASPLVGKVQNTIRTAIDSLGIELVEPVTPDSPMAKLIEKKGEGLVGFGFKVQDLEPWIERAKAKEIRIIAQVTQRGLREVHFHPKDMCGVFIELCEYEEKHPQHWASQGMV